MDPSPFNPEPYTSFGIAGVLMFAVVVLTALIWRLFNRQSEMFERRDHTLMDFMNGRDKDHRASLNENSDKMTKGLAELGDRMAKSQETLGTTMSVSLTGVQTALTQMARRVSDLMLTTSVISKVEQMQKKEGSVDIEAVEKVVRNVLDEQTRRER